jgi:hypothetical protein
LAWLSGSGQDGDEIDEKVVTFVQVLESEPEFHYE